MSKNGFSLIEIIIAIAVIGIVSAVALPSFSKIQTSAKSMSVKAVAHSLQISLESYFLQNGYYPEGNRLPLADIAEVLIESGDFPKMPKNPFTGRDYSQSDPNGQIFYSETGSKQGYRIEAYGKENADVLVELGSD